MTHIYTTEELIEILMKEQFACVKGDRTFPMPENADEIAIKHGGVMGAFLGAEKMFGVGVYHEFRDKIHEYQREHQVSGLTIETVEFDGKTYRFPELYDQLIALDSDMDILRAAKYRVVAAFEDYCSNPNRLVYLCHTLTAAWGGEYDAETTVDFIRHMGEHCEWATLAVHEECQAFCDAGASLCVGWGDPYTAPMKDDRDSDCFYFDAKSACGWSVAVEATPASMSIADIVEWRKRKESEGEP